MRTSIALVPTALLAVLSFLPGFFPHWVPPVEARNPPRTIRIAAICAFAGPPAPSNALSVEGARLCVLEINRAGGLLGRPVERVELDNQSTPIGSKAGPEWSSHALPAVRVAQRADIPMGARIATSPDATKVGDFVFRARFTDRFQGEVMARFARSRFFQPAGAVIFADIISDHSMALSAEFQKWFEALGGVVPARVACRRSQESFDGTARKALAAKPDPLFLPGRDGAARILEAAGRLGLSATPPGGDGWGTPYFLEKGGNRLPEGFYWVHWAPGMDTPASRAFLAKCRPRGDRVYPSHAPAH
ncbi:MAG: ABC transporter substrate-binding protein, partial [Desulfococcaceae bacterium]